MLEKIVLWVQLSLAIALPLSIQQASADIPPPPPPHNQQSKNGESSFATIPTAEARISILAENARVNIIRKANAREITVASNSPGNWHIREGLIRQAAISGRKGVGMTSDALGSRAIMNGLVYTMPDGPIKGLQMKKEGVFINGEKVMPLQGAGEPRLEGEDSLTVTVPDSYAGGLSVGCAGKSEISVSYWKGGDVSMVLVGDSSLTSGKLQSVNKAVVDNRGNGHLDVKGIQAKVFVANVQGKGTVNVSDGLTEMSNATVTGTGTMTLKGDFKNLKQAVDGTGKIEVSK